MSLFLVFGSNPALSLAEAQAFLEEPGLTLAGTYAISQTKLDALTCVDRLGGTVKAGLILLELKAGSDVADAVVELIKTHPRARKILFSVTVFGKPLPMGSRLPLEIKRRLQEDKVPVRWFADTNGIVSPAAVKKAGLLHDGYDICVFSEKERILVGFTETVQDIDAWSLRDMGRPARDAKNGMLPPKLARILVNLAGPNTARTLLDPFCGSGTILMEAALSGYDQIVGSDIDPRQVQDAIQNTDWLLERRLINPEQREKMRAVVSAASYIKTRVTAPVDAIVTEGFLGAPLKGEEPLRFLEEQAQKITEIWTEILPAFSQLQSVGGMIVGIWPILNSIEGQVAVDASDVAMKAGYTLVGPANLVYARPEQHVQRRIVVLKKTTA